MTGIDGIVLRVCDFRAQEKIAKVKYVFIKYIFVIINVYLYINNKYLFIINK